MANPLRNREKPVHEARETDGQKERFLCGAEQGQRAAAEHRRQHKPDKKQWHGRDTFSGYSIEPRLIPAYVLIFVRVHVSSIA